MIRGLDHVGIAVENLDQAIALWVNTLGGKLTHREIVSDQKVEVATIRIGTLCVELLAAASDDSPISRFLAKRGAGIHHIALESDATQVELDRMKLSNVSLIDESARYGAEQTLVGFLHPRSLNGVLVEIVERKKS